MADNRNNESRGFFSYFNKNKEKVLKSESGTFYLDSEGIVLRFEPADNNPFIGEKTKSDKNYIYSTDRSIRTFIVPEGVKGFASFIMHGTRVLERFELPEGLIYIGNNLFDHQKGAHCVFSDCILPELIIPQSVQEIGFFAFGHSHIETLQLPATLRSRYGRQFKDSSIGTLRLPKVWKGNVALGENNSLDLNGLWFNDDEYGYLRWPSTKIGNLEFY